MAETIGKVRLTDRCRAGRRRPCSQWPTGQTGPPVSTHPGAAPSQLSRGQSHRLNPWRTEKGDRAPVDGCGNRRSAGPFTASSRANRTSQDFRAY